MRDRYLFSADRKASEYKTVLEITPCSARLLTPSQAARWVRWVVSVALAVAYVTFASWLFIPMMYAFSLTGTPPAVAWPGLIAFLVLWFAGAFVLFFWWDRKSLPLLADTPSQGIDLILLGARSFGTFQDVRAKTLHGEEFHLVVDARAPRFWEAVRLLEGNAAAAR